MRIHTPNPTSPFSQSQHGASTLWVHDYYPDAPTPFIDLSGSITPYPYPFLESTPCAHQRLADPQEIQAAQRAFHDYCEAPDNTKLVLSSGMQPLISGLAAWLLHEHGRVSVAIISPTYSEYARVFKALGHDVREYTHLDDVPCGVGAVIICSPNNPNGAITPVHTIEAHIKKHAPNTLWIIDAAFADIYPENNYVSLAKQFPWLVVLRSLGKFFGIAGLRVSGALCSAIIADFLEVIVGPWPLSTAACQVLPNMLYDEAWQQATRQKICAEATEWRRILAGYANEIVGHTDLFTLIKVSDAARIHTQLAQQGIIVRIFSNNNTWIRLGLPHRTLLPRITRALENVYLGLWHMKSMPTSIKLFYK